MSTLLSRLHTESLWLADGAAIKPNKSCEIAGKKRWTADIHEWQCINVAQKDLLFSAGGPFRLIQYCCQQILNSPH